MLRFITQNHQSLFESNERSTGLARKSLRGGATTLITQGVQFGLQMSGTVILARLLTPGDYGLLGMAVIVIGFATIFQDAGLSTATIQYEQITHEQISSLFWINVFVSILIAVCVFASAPLVGWFFEKPELIPIIAVLSICFIINGLSVQHQSLMQRNMRFFAMGCIRIVSQAVTLLLTVILALRGWHYWALVGGSLASSVASTLTAFLLCPWLPGLMRKNTGVRKMLRFGAHMTGFNVINYFSRNADNLLIGKFIGPNALGLYTKAYTLFMLPIGQIRSPMNSVAMPVLSSLKDHPDRYIKYFQRFVDIMASLTIPLMIYCAFEADFLIRLLFGSQWLGAVSVFRILAIAGLIQPIYSTAGLVQISHGYSKQYFIWGCISAFVFILAFASGLPFGIEGVAGFYAAANYILFIPALIYCCRRTPIKLSLYLKTASIPLGISLVAAGISIAASWMIHGWVLKHLSFLCIYVAIVFISYFFRKALRETIGLFAADSSFQSLHRRQPIEEPAGFEKKEDSEMTVLNQTVDKFGSKHA
jgi:O-antigen/teichoic acid export membrane protein